MGALMPPPQLNCAQSTSAKSLPPRFGEQQCCINVREMEKQGCSPLSNDKQMVQCDLAQTWLELPLCSGTQLGHVHTEGTAGETLLLKGRALVFHVTEGKNRWKQALTAADS